MMFYIKIQR